MTTLPRIGGMSKEKEDKKSNESTYDENKSTHFDMSENNTLTAESKMLLLFAFLNSPGLKCNHSLLDLSPNDCISFDLLPPSILGTILATVESCHALNFWYANKYDNDSWRADEPRRPKTS